MVPTRNARLHWPEMAWYGWAVSAALVVTGSALGYVLGFDGTCALLGA
jgi:hypothetical protein